MEMRNVDLHIDDDQDSDRQDGYQRRHRDGPPAHLPRGDGGADHPLPQQGVARAGHGGHRNRPVARRGCDERAGHGEITEARQRPADQGERRQATPPLALELTQTGIKFH